LDVTSASIGRTLRSSRRNRRLTLADVARRSDGEFKPSTLGAYERGERSIPLARLSRLATIYGMPANALFLASQPVDIDLVRLDELQESRHRTTDGIVVNTARFASRHDATASTLIRFVDHVLRMRGSPRSDVVVLRRSDIAALGTILDVRPDEVDRYVAIDDHNPSDREMVPVRPN
jgi:transcriptional regulator with XRE-family HTH domain